jgi:DNA-binding response OmpR family regulator
VENYCTFLSTNSVDKPVHITHNYVKNYRMESEIKQGEVGKHILILEDETFLAHLLEKKFIDSNFKVFIAVDVLEARKILEKESVDLILLDIMLPGVNGMTFLQELKKDEKLKSLPVVIISNFGDKEKIDQGLRAGAADYIVKSNSTPEDIVSRIKTFIT